MVIPFPENIKQNYEIHEWRHASAILRTDFPREWEDVVAVLTDFKLRRSEVEIGGGNKSPVACRLDYGFAACG